MRVDAALSSSPLSQRDNRGRLPQHTTWAYSWAGMGPDPSRFSRNRDRLTGLLTSTAAFTSNLKHGERHVSSLYVNIWFLST